MFKKKKNKNKKRLKKLHSPWSESRLHRQHLKKFLIHSPRNTSLQENFLCLRNISPKSQIDCCLIYNGSINIFRSVRLSSLLFVKTTTQKAKIRSTDTFLSCGNKINLSLGLHLSTFISLVKKTKKKSHFQNIIINFQRAYANLILYKFTFRYPKSCESASKRSTDTLTIINYLVVYVYALKTEGIQDWI